MRVSSGHVRLALPRESPRRGRSLVLSAMGLPQTTDSARTLASGESRRLAADPTLSILTSARVFDQGLAAVASRRPFAAVASRWPFAEVANRRPFAEVANRRPGNHNWWQVVVARRRAGPLRRKANMQQERKAHETRRTAEQAHGRDEAGRGPSGAKGLGCGASGNAPLGHGGFGRAGCSGQRRCWGARRSPLATAIARGGRRPPISAWEATTAATSRCACPSARALSAARTFLPASHSWCASKRSRHHHSPVPLRRSHGSWPGRLPVSS